MREKLLALISKRVFLTACIFLASFFIFAFIADKTVFGKEDVFDNQVQSFFSKHSSPMLVDTMRRISFLGSSYFLLPAYVFLIVYVAARQKFRQATDIAVIAVSSFLAMQGLKRLFHRQRPESAIVEGLTNYSFPSGHSLSIVVFCSILAYLVRISTLSNPTKLLLIIALFLVALMVGISRIVLGVHFATDVIAGFCLGVMWVLLSFAILRRLRN